MNHRLLLFKFYRYDTAQHVPSTHNRHAIPLASNPPNLLKHLDRFEHRCKKVTSFSVKASCETVRAAIAAVYSDTDVAEKSRAAEFLVAWRDSDAAFPMSLELFASGSPGQVVFIACLVIKRVIQCRWSELSEESVKQCVDLLVTYAKAHASDSDSPVFNSVLVCLADIVLLNWSLFGIVQSFGGQLLLRFCRTLLEESEEQFVYRMKLSVSVKKNLICVIGHFVEILGKFEVTSEWIELFVSMYTFVEDFATFTPFVAKIVDACKAMKFPAELLKLFSVVLTSGYEQTPPGVAFYVAFVEMVMGCADLCLRNGLDSDSAYTFAVYLWDLIFDISVDLFTDFGLGELLQRIVEHVVPLLKATSREDELFLDFVDHATVFAVGLPDTEDLRPFCQAFLLFLSDLIDSSPFYHSSQLKNAFESLSEEWDELFIEFLRVKFQSPSDALFFAIASTVSNRTVRNEFVLPAAKLLLSSSEPPVSALFFVERCGVMFDELSESLLELAMSKLGRDPHAVLNIAYVYSKSPMRSLVVKYANPVLSVAGKLSLPDLQVFLKSSFRVIDLLPEATQCSISLIVLEAAKRTPNMSKFREFIEPIINEVSVSAPENYRFHFFDGLLKAIEPYLLSPDEEIQVDTGTLLYLCLSHDYMANRETIADWVSRVLRIRPVLPHLLIVEQLIDMFPIESILSFFRDFDYSQNPVIGAKMVEILQTMFERWEGFSTAFDIAFVIRLLTNEHVMIVNNAIDLVGAMVSRGLPSDCCVAVIQAIFTAMPTMYHELQVTRSMRLIREMLSRGLLDDKSVALAFEQGFAPFNHPGSPEIMRSLAAGRIEDSTPHIISLIQQIHSCH